jgi:glycosyltransferase involved in cell wall biosynthesis
MIREICFPFVGESFGGSYRCSLEIIKHLDAASFKPKIVLHTPGPVEAELRRQGVNYELFDPPGPPGGSSYPAMARWIASRLPSTIHYLRSHPIDVIHGSENLGIILWALAAKVTGHRVVWHVHSRAMFALRHLPRLAMRYVCVSDYVRELLPTRFGDLACVIPNPFGPLPVVDRERARARLVAERGFPSGGTVIGFCGRLIDVKRPDVFIEAAHLIANECSGETAFILLGDGAPARRAALEALAEARGLAGRVHFLGFRPDAETLMAGFDILLVPAETEAFGRVLVEAMRVGTPVIASASGGHGEILRSGETGFLVEAGNPRAFADAALRLMGDQGLHRRIAAEAARAVAGRYEAGAVTAAVEAVYRDLLGPA